MTPREIAGIMYFVGVRQRHERADRLQLALLAAQGNPKKVKKEVEKLSTE